MRVSLDHSHIFASDPAVTTEFFQTMLGAAIVWDEVVAGVRGIRLQIGRAFIHIYDQPPKGPRGGAVHHLGIETDDLAGLVRTMTARGFVFRNPIREDKAFKYVMIAGPDDLPGYVTGTGPKPGGARRRRAFMLPILAWR